MILALLIFLCLAFYHVRQTRHEMADAIKKGYGNLDLIHSHQRLLWVNILLVMSIVMSVIALIVY